MPIGPGPLEAFDRVLTPIPDPFTIRSASSAGRYAHTGYFPRKEGGWRHGVPYDATDVIIAQVERTRAWVVQAAEGGWLTEAGRGPGVARSAEREDGAWGTGPPSGERFGLRGLAGVRF